MLTPCPTGSVTAKVGNEHSTQKQGWSPSEKAKGPQLGVRAAGSRHARRLRCPRLSQAGHSDLSLRLVKA